MFENKQVEEKIPNVLVEKREMQKEFSWINFCETCDDLCLTVVALLFPWKCWSMECLKVGWRVLHYLLKGVYVKIAQDHALTYMFKSIPMNVQYWQHRNDYFAKYAKKEIFLTVPTTCPFVSLAAPQSNVNINTETQTKLARFICSQKPRGPRWVCSPPYSLAGGSGAPLVLESQSNRCCRR